MDSESILNNSLTTQEKSLMKNRTIFLLLASALIFASCASRENQVKDSNDETETHEYFLLRPEAEQNYGYSHAVKIGDDLIISGAVSMNDSGYPTAVGDLAQQMKNCYSDLDKVLKHYGCTFDDVVVENIFTTNMAEFLNQAGYRNTIYKKNFPTGSWLEVKGLALPEFLIEIELEAHKSN
jgi:enamine deaminase RidA (YjgF/YER057c/UK114 family)